MRDQELMCSRHPKLAFEDAAIRLKYTGLFTFNVLWTLVSHIHSSAVGTHNATSSRHCFTASQDHREGGGRTGPKMQNAEARGCKKAEPYPSMQGFAEQSSLIVLGAAGVHSLVGRER